ncbi:MAG: DUF1697 domain-containing protein [Opitutaceae bacterium]
MIGHIAFLRGINLGRRRIKMDRLAALFEALAFSEVATFIASGNVIFASRSSGARLEEQIERHLRAELGYEVDTFVRTRAEVAAVAAFQPFPPAVMADAANTVHVGFLKGELSAAQRRGLEACRSATDEFRVDGREYFWLCRGIKTHESKIWAAPELRALKLPTSTMRNVTTLRRLAGEFPA